jgi:hypothetical protein
MSNPSRRVSVADMAGDDRQSVEHLLGAPLQDEQEVYIVAFQSGVEPDENSRRRALANMQKTFAKAEQHADQQGIAESEIDAAVDEAMDHVRYGKA